MRERLRDVRYADDFVILCRSREAAEPRWPACKRGLRKRLKLHPEEDPHRRCHPTGVSSFSYHFERGYRWPRKKSMGKVEHRIVKLDARRTAAARWSSASHRSTKCLQSLYGYFKHITRRCLWT